MFQFLLSSFSCYNDKESTTCNYAPYKNTDYHIGVFSKCNGAIDFCSKRSTAGRTPKKVIRALLVEFTCIHVFRNRNFTPNLLPGTRRIRYLQRLHKTTDWIRGDIRKEHLRKESKSKEYNRKKIHKSMRIFQFSKLIRYVEGNLFMLTQPISKLLKMIVLRIKFLPFFQSGLFHF